MDWERVETLAERAPSPADVHFHRLETVLARRLRARDEPVPPYLEEAERAAALTTMSATALLDRIRAAYGGPLLLVKGPEVAAHYPERVLRPFGDLDLITPDAQLVQEALLRAGFEPLSDEPDQPELHHRPPLVAPGLPLVVEIHTRPKWPSWTPAPTAEELFLLSVPARTNPSVSTLPPAPHAVLLAAHAWAHQPLRRILDLVDVSAVASEADPAVLAELARRWRVEAIWRATIAAADHLLADERPTVALRVWARNLPAVRERTVLESHLERWLGPFWGMPRARAVRTALANVGQSLRPARGETRRRKLRRTAITIRYSFAPKSAHDAAIRGHQAPAESSSRSEAANSAKSRPTSSR